MVRRQPLLFPTFQLTRFVVRRYSWWKSYFPDDVVALSGVSRGFRKGLDLMNQAMALGEDVKYRCVSLPFSCSH